MAAQQGSIQQQYTEDQIPDAKLQSISSIDDGVALLKNGTVQAVACSEGTADEYIEKNSELAKLDELFNIDQDYAGNRVGAPLGEKRLMKEVNKILKEVNKKVYMKSGIKRQRNRVVSNLL